MSIDWMAHARQGRVVEGGETGGVRVEIPGEGTVEARPSPALIERGIRPEPGDTVLLRTMDDGNVQVVRRHRFEPGREEPLLVPAVDPDVEYLCVPGEHPWLHPHKPLMYDWYDDWDRDLPTWRRLAKESGGPILELARGTGRVIFELARTGHEVTGVDFSRAMLDRAAEKLLGEPNEARQRVELIHGDMATWSDTRTFPLAFIACNSLHYMNSPTNTDSNEQRRRAIRTLFAHVAPGGLGVLSNIAPVANPPRRQVEPAPYLVFCQAGVNPNTNRWTVEYTSLWSDGDTGQAYDGPWRFVEDLEDGTRRTIEFAEPPESPEEIRLPDRPLPLTRAETLALMTEAGFRDIEVRSPKDLSPASEDERVVVFLGRR